MTDRLHNEPEIGSGIYTFPEAARIIRHRPDIQVSTAQLRNWLRTGLAPLLESDDGYPIISFAGLISLEIVRRLYLEGASVQRIRKFQNALAIETPEIPTPFAAGSFFTDGSRIWRQLNPDDEHVTEIVGYPNQVAWTEVIRSFSQEIRIDPDTSLASAWHLHPAVEIDPTIQFGKPVVVGTRVPIHTIAANLSVASVEQVASWYDLSTEQVAGVEEYLAAA